MKGFKDELRGKLGNDRLRDGKWLGVNIKDIVNDRTNYTVNNKS